MTLILIQHRVADYDRWKQAFDEDPVGRAQNGVLRHTVYRATDDPRTVFVQLEFSSRERAEQFMGRLRQLWGQVGSQMGFGGAEGVQARILDEVERIENIQHARH